MQDDNKNVYGANHPADKAEKDAGIREKVADSKEKSTADEMDDTRDKFKEENPASGGMGRSATPKQP